MNVGVILREFRYNRRKGEGNRGCGVAKETKGNGE